MLRAIAKPDTQNELRVNYELTIRALCSRVFEALTVAVLIDDWGGGPARVQARVHGDISFWDGEMYGSIREFEKPFRLIHTLRHVQWGTDCIESMVIWKLAEHPRGTLIQMSHTDLPSRKLCEMQDEFWAASFLGPLKAYLESRS